MLTYDSHTGAQERQFASPLVQMGRPTVKYVFLCWVLDPVFLHRGFAIWNWLHIQPPNYINALKFEPQKLSRTDFLIQA